MLTAFHWEEAKKIFLEKKIQNGRLKKTHFPAPPILNIFHEISWIGPWVSRID